MGTEAGFERPSLGAATSLVGGGLAREGPRRLRVPEAGSGWRWRDRPADGLVGGSGLRAGPRGGRRARLGVRGRTRPRGRERRRGGEAPPRPSPAPPRPARHLPPSGRRRLGFRFPSQAREAAERGEEARGRDRLGQPDSPALGRRRRTMAPPAVWAALAVGLQLWGAGYAVPVQVGDSRRPHAPGLARTPPSRGALAALPPGCRAGARGHRGAALRRPDGRRARARLDPCWASSPSGPRGRCGTRALGPPELWSPRRSPAPPPAQARVFGGWQAGPRLIPATARTPARTPLPVSRGGGRGFRTGALSPLRTRAPSSDFLLLWGYGFPLS